MTGSYVLDGATQAMIAALDSPQERDRLTRFLAVDLQDGKGTGILGDVFLLLKANRCYMEKLPGQFNRELVHPMQEHALRMEKSLGLQLEMQQRTTVQNERAAEVSLRSAERMEAIVPKVEGVVQTAFEGIDSSALTKKIEDSVVEGAVKPVVKVNEECNRLQKKIDERLPVLTCTLRWLTFGNLIVWAVGCALLFSAAAIYFVFSMEQEMVQTLQTRVRQEIENVHATAQVNQDTLLALSRLSVQIELHHRKDWSGQEMPNDYVLAMKGAWSGWTTWKYGDHYGTIDFTDQTTQLPISL